MNKKIILSKTILFVCIISFIVLFQFAFRDENTLIGVTTITAMLMLLERDLTTSPWRNTIKLVGVNLFIGCSATLAGFNMWLAIPINFIVLFILGHSLLYHFKNPMYVPFILQYLFILASPVEVNQLPLRLLALVFGAISIMALQLITNKKKLTKEGHKLLESISGKLLGKIECMRAKESYTEKDVQIREAISKFNKILYDKRENDFYIIEGGVIRLNLALSLEKISYLLNKVAYEGVQKEVVEDVYRGLKKVEICFRDENQIENLEADFHKILSKYEVEPIEDITSLELLYHLDLLKLNLQELKSLKKEQHKFANKTEKIPDEYKKHFVIKKELNTHSIKFCYALRLAVGLTLAAFLTDFFHLSEGRWIMYTVFSLTVPLYEMSKQRIKDRLFATVVGAIIISILFGIFKDITIRTLIIMLAGYIGSYFIQYRYNMICVTISAVGAAALMGNMQVFTVNRILFVGVGAVIAFLVNKYILLYRAEDHNKHLKMMYQEIIKRMFKEIYEVEPGNAKGQYMKNLLMIMALIENKFRMNTQISKGKSEEILTERHRIYATHIYELYVWLSKHEVKGLEITYILEDIKKLSQIGREGTKHILASIQKHMDSVKDINDKITLSMLIEILQEEENVRNLTQSML